MSSFERWREAEATVPARSSSDERVALTVAANAAYTEIRILDARFEPVALGANTGQVSVDVPPGLYEVGFRSAEGWQSQHAIVMPGAGEVRVEQDASNAPAPKTVSPVTIDVSHDANVIVDLTPASGKPGAGAIPIALNKLTVTLINAEDGRIVATDLDKDSLSLWRFDVTPGVWRLRINEAHPRQPFEIAITVIPDYVACVTAPFRQAQDGDCLDLERLRFRLLMSGEAARPRPDIVGFEEAALTALAADRPLFGPSIEQLIDSLLDEKALNPMLGILAGHLCHRGDDEAFNFQERLIRWLEQATGTTMRHPDVAALRIGYLMRIGGALADQPPVLFPPLLTASWRILLEASKLEPRLIPAGSLSDQVADRLWASSQWIAWTAPPIDAAASMARLDTARVEVSGTAAAGAVEANGEAPEPARAEARHRDTREAATVTESVELPEATLESADRGGRRQRPPPRRGGPRSVLTARRRTRPVATSPAAEGGGADPAIDPTIEATPRPSFVPTPLGERQPSMRSPSANTAVIATGLAHAQLRDWIRDATGKTDASGVAWTNEQGITPAEAAIASAVYPILPNEELQVAIGKFVQSFTGLTEGANRPTALERTEALGLPRATIERSLDSLATKLVDHAAMFKIKL